MFSDSADATYLRSLQDRNYSFSLNYYRDLRREDSVTIKGNSTGALNTDGKKLYTNNRTQFGILCGDHYVSKYQTGGLLLMSLNIEFSNYLQL